MPVGSEMSGEGLEGEVESRRRKEEEAANAEKLGIQFKFKVLLRSNLGICF